MLEKIKDFFISFLCILWITLVAVVMAGPQEIGGAQMNGFLAFALWIVFMFLVVKKHPLISGVVSTILLIVIRVSKFGVGDMGDFSEISDELMQILMFVILGFIFYKIILGKSSEDTMEEKKLGRRRERQTLSYMDEYDDYDSARMREEMKEPKLESGSVEYWEYREAAERIYRDFCAARNTDERLYHKKRGDKLKTRLISEYGYKDECVRDIIDAFLDLRV